MAYTGCLKSCILGSCTFYTQKQLQKHYESLAKMTLSLLEISMKYNKSYKALVKKRSSEYMSRRAFIPSHSKDLHNRT